MTLAAIAGRAVLTVVMVAMAVAVVKVMIVIKSVFFGQTEILFVYFL